MDDLDAQIQGAEAYESLLIPAVFGAWPPRVLAGAEVGPGQRVLDVACGTGICAREAVRLVGQTGSVAGVDVNAGMLAVALRHAPGVEWREANAEELPFGDESFDAVVSQFGLMFFSRPVIAVREMLRVLRPGGRFAIAVFANIEKAPAYAAEAALFERLAGPNAAAAIRAPFALGDWRDLGELFGKTGVKSVRIAAEQGVARFPSIRAMVEADLRGWLPAMGVHLDEATIAAVLEAAEEELAAFRQPDGSLETPAPAYVIKAEKE